MLLAWEHVGGGEKVKNETHGKHLLQGGILGVSVGKRSSCAACRARAAVKERRGSRASCKASAKPGKQSEDPKCNLGWRYLSN